jgi:hypothetical protein
MPYAPSGSNRNKIRRRKGGRRSAIGVDNSKPSSSFVYKL